MSNDGSTAREEIAELLPRDTRIAPETTALCLDIAEELEGTRQVPHVLKAGTAAYVALFVISAL